MLKYSNVKTRLREWFNLQMCINLRKSTKLQKTKLVCVWAFLIIVSDGIQETNCFLMK